MRSSYPTTCSNRLFSVSPGTMTGPLSAPFFRPETLVRSKPAVPTLGLWQP